MGLIKPKAQSTTAAGDGPDVPPPFVACPRKDFTPGRQDWITLSDPRFSDFDICPTCYQKCIAPTRYANQFKNSAPKPAEVSTCCDFASFWVRLAWQWLYKMSQPDVSLLSIIGSVKSPDGPCPTDATTFERKSAVRKWYTIRHPSTGQLLDDFTMCSDCVLHLESLLPPLKGFFILASPYECEATCDLRGEGKRTAKYIDLMIDAAALAIQQGRRDVTPLADYIALVASVPECGQAKGIANNRCHMINHNGEFITCEECYLEVVKPNLHTPGWPLARLFSPTPEHCDDGAQCDIWSPHMREVWEEANKRNDFSWLETVYKERNAKNEELGAKLLPLRKRWNQLIQQKNMHSSLARVQNQMATSSMIAGVYGGWRATVSFSSRKGKIA